MEPCVEEQEQQLREQRLQEVDGDLDEVGADGTS